MVFWFAFYSFFSAISFIVPSATFGFILFYQIICRNHLTSNHQPSEGPWFMGPSLILPPSPPLLTWKSILHHCTARTENIKTFAPKMRGRTVCYLYLQYANLTLWAWRNTFRNVCCLFLKAVVAYQTDRELTEGKITSLRTCARLERHDRRTRILQGLAKMDESQWCLGCFGCF